MARLHRAHYFFVHALKLMHQGLFELPDDGQHLLHCDFAPKLSSGLGARVSHGHAAVLRVRPAPRQRVKFEAGPSPRYVRGIESDR